MLSLWNKVNWMTEPKYIVQWKLYKLRSFFFSLIFELEIVISMCFLQFIHFCYKTVINYDYAYTLSGAANFILYGIIQTILFIRVFKCICTEHVYRFEYIIEICNNILGVYLKYFGLLFFKSVSYIEFNYIWFVFNVTYNYCEQNLYTHIMYLKR